MKLFIVTLVLDGMPWIVHHLPTFNRLPAGIDWQWIIVEGAAMNTRDTGWCKPQAARLSTDGTSGYLDGLATHPRVRVIRNKMWDGKVSMCNAALRLCTEPGVLLQVDSDELWSAEQLSKLVQLFDPPAQVDVMKFECNFFYGPNIVATDHSADWTRAWRYKPGMQFDSHEPPVLSGNRGTVLGRDFTQSHGLVFDHMSYALESQVAAKEKFYGYAGAVAQWRKFQQNKAWPVARVRDFLPFAGQRATADLYIK